MTPPRKRMNRLVIEVMLAALPAPLVVGAGWLWLSSASPDKDRQTRDDLQQLRDAVLAYRESHRELPSGWLAFRQDIPRDPWGNEYHYFAAATLPDGFGIFSVGRDGNPASSDDLNSWMP